MGELILTTFDWVPNMPRGYVRDIRVRWALEEAGLLYRVESVPFRERNAPRISTHQPFGQVPWLTDGEHIDLRERRDPAASGRAQRRACYRADACRSQRARPRNGCSRHSIRSRRPACPGRCSSLFRRQHGETPECASNSTAFLQARTGANTWNPILAGREWLAGTFSVADILMADVLRLVDRFDGLAGHPACRAYVARATARPSFVKAHADQMAHFAAADAA